MAEGDPCSWCGGEYATDVVVVPGRKNRKIEPVCEKHAQQFEKHGGKTTRIEDAERQERERKKRTWGGGRKWR